MIGRAVIIVIALAIAILATLAQLDQQSRAAPLYGAFVPDAMSGNAARERSKIALQLGDDETALAEARTGVSLRPLPAESLSVLALAALAAEDADTARDALGAASQRGWREPISQLASGQSAFDQGEYVITSQRINALLATGALTDPALALLADLVAVPGGREAFARQMVGAERLRGNVITSAYDAVDPLDWAKTLALADENGADLRCGALSRLANRYRRDGRADEVALFWPERCSPA